MATTFLTCRVCGKKYKGCRTAEQADGIFRWQAVSCSPECGEIYLQRILESRNLAVADKVEEYAESAQKRQRRKVRKPMTEVTTDVVDAPVEADAEAVAESEE